MACRGSLPCTIANKISFWYSYLSRYLLSAQGVSYPRQWKSPHRTAQGQDPMLARHPLAVPGRTPAPRCTTSLSVWLFFASTFPFSSSHALLCCLPVTTQVWRWRMGWNYEKTHKMGRRMMNFFADSLFWWGFGRVKEKWMDFGYPQKTQGKKPCLPENKKRRLPKEPPCLSCFSGIQRMA